MAEVFATFAAVAGVAELTLQAIKNLVNDVQAIKDAPTEVKKLEQDLDATAGSLQTLEANQDTLQHLSADAKRALAAALENCKSICEVFQAKLKRWMRHSTDQRMHWWDRVRVAILADKNVETLSKQLLQCKVTVNTAIGTVTLLASLQSREATQEIRTILLTREDMLKQQMVSANQDIEQISADLAIMKTGNRPGNNEEQGENGEDLENLDAQRLFFQNTRDLFQVLLSDIHFQRTGQRIQNIEITDRGRLLVGQFNTNDHKNAIQQDINNVKATKEGMGIVGIAEGLDINSFFK